ncbi:hypothetical protein DSO57_1025990 [Entomophthora muscae]|uniref:Uncharacterized protein n=1 Tax=Entomophthora muscae TaxID=34485 RepID=A0ACC2RGW3_9FUNG|nr:hypothetical protein DSO57_1025990 [Entomophthora muscae]
MYIRNDDPIEKTIWISFSQEALNDNQDSSNHLVKSFTTPPLILKRKPEDEEEPDPGALADEPIEL